MPSIATTAKDLLANPRPEPQRFLSAATVDEAPCRIAARFSRGRFRVLQQPERGARQPENLVHKSSR